jgi:phosphoglycolate phosphatase
MPVVFPMVRAALFDLDGTLVETHIDFSAMTAAMEQMALDANVSEEVTRGKDILGLVDAAAKNIKARGGDGMAFRREAFARLEEMELVGCSHPNLLAGTQELLAALIHKEVKVGVVTRNCRRVANELLAKFALPHHLLLTRDDVARTKPNPEHLWEALRMLGEKPEASAMVGDHWMDIQAGINAGCAATLGVLGAHGAEWFAPCPPTATARDLAEAWPLFGLG